MIINPYVVKNNTLEKVTPVKEEDPFNQNLSNMYKDAKALAKVVSKELIELGEQAFNKKPFIKKKIKEILYNKYKITDEKIINEIIEDILNQIYGYGILQKYIDNENISDIRVVEKDLIYIKANGKWAKTGQRFQSKEDLEEYIRFCAMKNGAIINFENPIAIFSDKRNGLRIEVGIEPSNIKSPNMVIRIHRKENQITLEQLFVKFEMLNANSYINLKNVMKESSNVILCGKGGSGKTTLLKALINEIPREVAITTNEETSELYLKDRNVIQRECILNRTDEKNITLEKLSKHSLVMSNDVIIIGELKGSEANTFFDSISTGHVGLATVHSDCIENVVNRLITLIKKDIRAQSYHENFLEKFLATSIDYVVFLKDFKVSDIAKINYEESIKTIQYERMKI